MNGSGAGTTIVDVNYYSYGGFLHDRGGRSKGRKDNGIKRGEDDFLIIIKDANYKRVHRWPLIKEVLQRRHPVTSNLESTRYSSYKQKPDLSKGIL